MNLDYSKKRRWTSIFLIAGTPKGGFSKGSPVLASRVEPARRKLCRIVRLEQSCWFPYLISEDVTHDIARENLMFEKTPDLNSKLSEKMARLAPSSFQSTTLYFLRFTGSTNSFVDDYSKLNDTGSALRWISESLLFNWELQKLVYPSQNGNPVSCKLLARTLIDGFN